MSEPRYWIERVGGFLVMRERDNEGRAVLTASSVDLMDDRRAALEAWKANALALAQPPSELSAPSEPSPSRSPGAPDA